MKRGKWRKTPKTERKGQITEADSQIKQLTLAQNPTCQYPGCNKQAVDNHHIVHRRYFSLRWRRANNVALCRMHHAWEGIASKCIQFTDAMVEIVGGQKYYDALRAYANQGPSEEPGDAITRLKKVLDR
jgi:hypothetical protein